MVMVSVRMFQDRAILMFMVCTNSKTLLMFIDMLRPETDMEFPSVCGEYH